jgi:hypothetical protein
MCLFAKMANFVAHLTSTGKFNSWGQKTPHNNSLAQLNTIVGMNVKHFLHGVPCTSHKGRSIIIYSISDK